MRRMDRHPTPVSIQGYYNRYHWSNLRNVPNEHGWIVPWSHYQGWEEYNRAAYALRCVMTWSRINRQRAEEGPRFEEGSLVDRDGLHRYMDVARIESDLRTFHFCLARSRACDRPRLP